MFQRITLAMVLMLFQLLLISMVSIAQEPKELEDFVWIELGDENDEHGLIQFDFPNDGQTDVVKKGNPKKECRLSPNADTCRYMYFRIDDTFLFGGNNEVWIVIEYFDIADPVENGIDCHYDSNGAGDVDGAYRGASFGAFDFKFLEGTNEWRFHTWHITDGRFENRQNGNSDFRVHRRYGDLWLNRVWVSLIAPPDPFEPSANESWPWAVEPSMKLTTTWGAIKALKR